MAITPGQQLEEYNIVRQLGQGAFGTVYLAQDTHLDRFVAIKELTVTSQTDGTAFKRFIQEARTAGGLNHPHIVTVHGLKIIKNDVYLVMEYLSGGSLRHQLERRGYLPVEEAVQIALHTCEGLAVAHAKGIIHRDIKPENVLLTEGGQAKIGDFGIAHVPQGTGGTLLTQAGFQPGTVVYMSPEQIRGKPLDGRSDVYQVGILLYELLTGQHYIDLVNIEQQAREAAGSNLMRYQARFFDILDEAICEAAVTRPREINPNIPAWLEQLILEALSKEMQERPTAANLTQKFSDNPTKLRSFPVAVPTSKNYFAEFDDVKVQADVHFNRAISYKDQSAIEDAIYELKVVLTLDPAYTEAYYNLGLIYADQGLWNEAIRAYEAALKLAPNYSRVHIFLGVAYANSERFNEALQEAEIAQSLGDHHAEELIRLVKGLKSHKLSQGIHNLEAKEHLDRGMEWAEQGFYKEATQEFRTALAIDPNYIEAHYNLGGAYLEQGQWQKAKQEYQTVLQLNPNIAEAHNILGVIYEETRDIDKAAAEFQATILLDPSHVGAHVGLGKIFGSQGQLTEAATEFETALNLSPDDPRIHYALALTYQEQGRLSDAIDHAQIADRLGFVRANKLLKELLNASPISNRTGSTSDNQSISITIRDLLDEGVRLKREGHYRAAKEAYYQAIQMSPTNVMAYYSLAKVCYLTEEYTESVINYLRAMHLSLCNQISFLSKDSQSRFMVEQQLKELPPGIFNKFRSIHEYAPLLFLDVNTPAHLAHTLVDLDQGYPKPKEIQAYIPVYRRALSGARGQLDDEFEDSFYHPVGVNFLLDNIRWDKITSSDVLSLYPETKQLLPNKTGPNHTLPHNGTLSVSKQTGMNEALQITEKQEAPGMILVCFICGEVLGFEGLVGPTTWKCPTCGELTSFKDQQIIGTWHPEISGVAEPTISIYKPVRTAIGLGFGNPFGEDPPLCAVVSMIEQAQELLNNGNGPEAINVLKKALKLRPNHSGAYTLLGSAYEIQRLLDQAALMYQKAIDISPEFSPPHYYLGVIYLSRDNFVEAAKEFQQVIELAPDFADGYYHLGLTHLYNKNISLATGYFEKAARLNPEDIATALNLSICYKAQSRLSEAVQELKRILALHPNSGDAHHNLGSLYMDLEKFDAAIREYQIAAQINPQDIDTHKALGYAFRMKQEFTKAIHEYKTALHLQPDNLQIRYDLGVICLQQGMDADAIRELKIVTEQVPDFAEAHFYLGVAYGKQGHLDKATHEANIALKLGDTRATELLKTIKHTRINQKKGWFN